MAVPDGGLFLDQTRAGWQLAGGDAGRFGLVNDYLSYLGDRNYSPRTIRTYGFALLAFCRTQASIQKLVVEAYRERSRNLLLQALLLDPVVTSVANAEQMLDHMLELQKDYLPAFS